MLIEQNILRKELLVTQLEETETILSTFFCLFLSPPFSFHLPLSFFLFFIFSFSILFFTSHLSSSSPFHCHSFPSLSKYNLYHRKHDLRLYIRICPLGHCRLETTQPLQGKEIVDRQRSTLVGFSRGPITYLGEGIII